MPIFPVPTGTSPSYWPSGFVAGLPWVDFNNVVLVNGVDHVALPAAHVPTTGWPANAIGSILFVDYVFFNPLITNFVFPIITGLTANLPTGAATAVVMSGGATDTFVYNGCRPGGVKNTDLVAIYGSGISVMFASTFNLILNAALIFGFKMASTLGANFFTRSVLFAMQTAASFAVSKGLYVTFASQMGSSFSISGGESQSDFTGPGTVTGVVSNFVY